MNTLMFAEISVLGIFSILLVLLVMAGVAVGAVLLVVWLLRRKTTLPSPPGNPPSSRQMPPPSSSANCPRCGAKLPPDSPQGLCPRCVLGVGLDTQTEATGEFGPHGTKIVPPPEAEVAKRFPHLEILGCLGQGGMGVVYKARQPKLNRLVALKILAPEKGADPKFAERFLREAQALARLSHPNIVTVHDFGEADGMFFLLMEFVDGMTLRQLLREGLMKPEAALAIVPPICEALQFAHEQGVVHRDIKPENVLLDKQGRVKIADFGIAKLVAVAGQPLTPSLSPSDGERVSERTGDGTLTQDQIIGTPHYMAPEQVEHPQTVDHRADIYSLGVVFYEMLTGELPLGKFQPPSKKVQIDVRLDEVVLRALEKKPELRFQQASEVKTCVETIAATPPGSSRREEAHSEKSEIRNPKSEITPRFSRTAIVGACCLALTVLAVAGALIAASQSIALALQTPNLPRPLPQQVLDQGHAIFLVAILSQVFGAISALAGTTLGWIAISQIRRSNEKIRGLGLAMFDGLLFPLLIVNVLLAFLIFFAVPGVRNLLMDAFQVGLGYYRTGAALAVLASIVAVLLLVDFLVVWAVWRAVDRHLANGQAAPTPGSAVGASAPRPGSAWKVAVGASAPRPGSAWKVAVVIAAAVMLVLSIPVIVFLMRTGLPTFQSPLLAASAFGFGQEVQLSLVSLESNSGDRFLDLDEAQIAQPPRQYSGWSMEQKHEWLRQNGIDLMIRGNALQPWYLLTPVDNETKFTKVPAYSWERGLAPALGEARPEQATPVQFVDQGVKLLQLGRPTHPNNIFAFQTANGACGLLQVSGRKSGAGGEPIGLKLRFKKFQSSSAAARVDPPSVVAPGVDAVAFGRVIERIVTEAINLDDGSLLEFPSSTNNDLSLKLAENIRAAELKGVDAYMADSMLVTLGMTLAPLPENHWDASNAVQIASQAVLSASAADKPPLVKLDPDKDGGRTYAFKTREGGVGLLQITGSTDNPSGVKLRYKLVQTAAASSGNRKPEDTKRKFVRLVVDKAAMTFEGQPTTWGDVGALLEKVPERKNTVLECAVTSDQITVQQQNEWFGKCIALAISHGFEYASFIGIHPLGSKGTPASIGGSTGATRLPAFGPVIERALLGLNESRSNCFIDLDTGKLIDLPASLSPTNHAAVWEWAKEKGLDAAANTTTEVRGMLGYELTGQVVQDEVWNALEVEAIEKQLAGVKFNQIRFDLDPLSQCVFTVNTMSTDPTRTYAFRTREGSCGLLQFLSYSDAPGGRLKFRYKLVQRTTVSSFGPEKEVTLTEFNNRDGQEALDLDSGTVFKQPKDMDQWSEKGLEQWVKENGVDLFVDHGPGGAWGLMTTTAAGLELAHVANDQWGATSAAGLVRELAADPAPLKAVTDGVKKIYLPLTDAQPPMTFAFKTRRGGVGVLQITGYTRNPRGVNVRYRLVQPQQSQAAGSPSSQAPARFTFAVELIAPTGATDKRFLNLDSGDLLWALVTKQPMAEIRRDVSGGLSVAFHHQHALLIKGEHGRQFWESTSPDDLMDRHRRQGFALLPFERNFVFPIQKEQLPMTFELPGAGILQVQEILDGDPPSVKLRYKQVRASPTGAAASSPNASPTEADDPLRPYVVKGRVTDEQGNGLGGVSITAHCGEGSLYRTGETQSGPDGRYTLHFRQGMLIQDESSKQWRVGVQAATIHPDKPGYFDANLNRQGDLLMADRLPAPGEDVGWNVDTNKLVLPHQPFELNFVMLPAATVEGQLQDENGQPIAQQSLCLEGAKLPPSSSVLACVATRTNGYFRFENVPTIGRWWFSLSRPNERRKFRSEEFNFVRDFNEPFALRLIPGDSTRGIVVTGRNRMSATPSGAAQAASFGPVIERVLPFIFGTKRYYLQFHTGEFFRSNCRPGGIMEPGEMTREQIASAGGADVEAMGGAENFQFLGQGCLFTREHSPDWDKTSAEAVAKEVQRAHWITGVIETKKKDLPATWLFKTARGETGILQLLEIVDLGSASQTNGLKPYGLKLRYKLVPSPATAATLVEPGSVEPESLSGTLPTGVTVKLIGLSSYPTKGQPWWLPNGQVCSAPLFDGSDLDIRSMHPSAHGEHSIEFAFAITGLKSGTGSEARIAGPESTLWAGRQFKHGVVQPEIKALVLNLPTNATVAHITVSLAATGRVGLLQRVTFPSAASAAKASSPLLREGESGITFRNVSLQPGYGTKPQSKPTP